MSTRLRRVEASLQRAIAETLALGEIADPRVRSSAVAVTGVQVSPDLSHARVYVDVLTTTEGEPKQGELAVVLAGLRSAASEIRRHVGKKMQLKRTPALHFVRDDAIETGASIERILLELRQEAPSPADPPEEPDPE